MDRASAEISKKMRSELSRLKRLVNLGHELEVEWLPDHIKYSHGRQLSGEVLDNNKIYVYEKNEAEAIATLHHEYWDYVTSQLVAPYQKMINSLISLFEDEAYRRKERFVKRLCGVLNFKRDENDNR